MPYPTYPVHVVSSWRQFREQGSQRARGELIHHYRYLVDRTWKRIARRVNGPLAPEDLFQVGQVALIEAVDRFDPAAGEFEPYAETWIRGEMFDQIRGSGWHGRTGQRPQRRIDGATARLQDRGISSPSNEEVAAELGLDEEAFLQLFVSAIVPQIISVEQPECSQALQVLETVRSPDLGPEALLLMAEQKRLLERATGFLSPQQRQVIALYYQAGFSLRQIGTALGFSHVRAKQIHDQSITRLAGFLLLDREAFVENPSYQSSTS